MSFHHERRQYGQDRISLGEHANNPLALFKQWLDEAIQAQTLDATALHVATVGSNNMPDSRVVLLKEITEKGFVFFTDYTSIKGQQLAKNPQVAASFYWPILSRQIRMRGFAEKTDPTKNQEYFNKRPIASQIAAIISKQSEVIDSLEIIEKQVADYSETYPLNCPTTWGGYEVIIHEIEFFLGRDNRINERILYAKKHGNWQLKRLSP